MPNIEAALQLHQDFQKLTLAHIAGPGYKVSTCVLKQPGAYQNSLPTQS